MDRLGYSMVVDWTSCDFNSDPMEHNFGGFGLANSYYYYNQNYSMGLEAYLVSEPMDAFKKHRKLLHSPHLWL